MIHGASLVSSQYLPLSCTSGGQQDSAPRPFEALEASHPGPPHWPHPSEQQISPLWSMPSRPLLHHRGRCRRYMGLRRCRHSICR
ncbi:unnamed protein product [Ectocarpus sp. 4 AP-2014]